MSGVSEDFNIEYINTDSAVLSFTVREVGESDIYCHGMIKWDGCSNWYFDEQDRVMLHFCGRKDADRIQCLIAAVYDKATEVLGDSVE